MLTARLSARAFPSAAPRFRPHLPDRVRQVGIQVDVVVAESAAGAVGDHFHLGICLGVFPGLERYLVQLEKGKEQLNEEREEEMKRDEARTFRPM